MFVERVKLHQKKKFFRIKRTKLNLLEKQKEKWLKTVETPIYQKKVFRSVINSETPCQSLIKNERRTKN